MENFFINAIVWTLAFYGVYEIIKNIAYCFSKPNLIGNEGAYIIIAVKDAEDYIEYFLRSMIFRILYGKEDYIKQLLVMDLGSKDKTKSIIKRMEFDFECIKIIEYGDLNEIVKECKTND